MRELTAQVPAVAVKALAQAVLVRARVGCRPGAALGDALAGGPRSPGDQVSRGIFDHGSLPIPQSAPRFSQAREPHGVNYLSTYRFTTKRGLRAVVSAVAFSVALLIGSPIALAQVYSSPAGSYDVHGAILAEYQSLGGPASFLGSPLTNEVAVRGGAVNHFQGGSIYWSPATGAHAVKGAIRDRWASLGWENGFLGFPTTGEVAVRGGAVTHFQGGSVYWSPATGAHAVKGAIRDRWASLGWENSALRFPRTDEYSVPGGAAQDFACGSIQWMPGSGAVVVGCGPSSGPVYYENCTDVWNAIERPLYRTDPGYETPRLDRDGDGVACETDPR
jgi:hypothetical protein